MKPPPFEYHAPTSLEEALSLLTEYGYEAKILAGGQSLVPSMNFRLAAPSILIDLNGIEELFGVEALEDGDLRIKAMTRHRTVERDPHVASISPLITEAMPHIAHPQIRNRGTVGGSLAHADPAAELPALMVALGAQMEARSSTGTRTIAASDFFLGVFTTALEPEEVLASVTVPAMAPRTGTAFEEVARRRGDYALAGAAAVVTLDGAGAVDDSRLVFFSIGDGPVVSESARKMLRGIKPTKEAIRDAAEAVEADIDPTSDIHATTAYRQHLCKVLARKTLSRATERARGAERA